MSGVHEQCSRGPAATARPPSPPDGFVYCTCHEICTPASPSAVPTKTKSTLQVHQVLCLPRNLHDRAAQRRPHVHPVLLKALFTAPATKCALQVHQVLCLPRNLHSRFTKCCACHEICTTGSRGPAATTRLPSPPEGSVYCACHEICTPGSPSAVPTTKSTLQVHQALCLPRNLHDRQPRPSGDHASTRSS